MGERNLPPTPQRARQAREQGQVAQSQDLLAVARLGVVGELGFATEPHWRAALSGSLDGMVRLSVRGLAEQADAGGALMTQAFGWLAGMAALAAALALVLTLLQTRMNIAVKALSRGADKLNPGKNLAQMFSAKKLLMTGIGLLKLSVILAVAAVVIVHRVPDLLESAGRLSPGQGWGWAVDTLHGVFRSVLLCLAVIAAVDYAIQWHMNRRSLLIDLETLRRDHKESEGDPHAKGFRKSVARELASAAAPPKADAVVVNPDHIAVVLSFDTGAGGVPRVAAKARDAQAVRLRDELGRQGVPVIRYVELARRLYATSRQGGTIPRDCLKAVALVYAAVQELSRRPPGQGPMEVHEVDPELAHRLLRRA